MTGIFMQLPTTCIAIVSSTVASYVPLFGVFNMSMQDGADSARGNDQVADLFGVGGVFSTITNILLFIIGAISVIMLIIGGLRYVLSGGDSKSVAAAKNTILYAIIGVIIAILAYAAVNFVITSLTGAGGSDGGGVDV